MGSDCLVYAVDGVVRLPMVGSNAPPPFSPQARCREGVRCSWRGVPVQKRGVEDCRAEEKWVFAQVAGKLWIRTGRKGPWERSFFVPLVEKGGQGAEIFFPIEKLTSATNTSGS